MINIEHRPKRIRFFAFLLITLSLTALGSSVSAFGLVYDVMDASDAGLTVGGGTTGLLLAAPVLVLMQVVSAITMFFFWRMGLRPSDRPPGRLGQSGRIFGLILLTTGLALTLVVLVAQISIDAREHAVAFASLRTLEAFCCIGFAAAAAGALGRLRR